jgi:plasmid stability protein
MAICETSLIKASLMAEGVLGRITTRNLDDLLKSHLRVQAAVHGRLIRDDAREVLRSAHSRVPGRQRNLAAAIRARFARLGGFELPAMPRDDMRAPPSFTDTNGDC